MTPELAAAYYNEGFEAYCNGTERDECPYNLDSDAAQEWREGWDGAQKEMGPSRDDRYLDDPRRGQAEFINRDRSGY